MIHKTYINKAIKEINLEAVINAKMIENCAVACGDMIHGNPDD